MAPDRICPHCPRAVSICRHAEDEVIIKTKTQDIEGSINYDDPCGVSAAADGECKSVGDARLSALVGIAELI